MCIAQTASNAPARPLAEVKQDALLERVQLFSQVLQHSRVVQANFEVVENFVDVEAFAAFAVGAKRVMMRQVWLFMFFVEYP